MIGRFLDFSRPQRYVTGHVSFFDLELALAGWSRLSVLISHILFARESANRLLGVVTIDGVLLARFFVTGKPSRPSPSTFRPPGPTSAQSSCLDI
jgi:hypothetical protein